MHANGTNAGGTDLVLDRLPNGQTAWLRPRLDPEPSHALAEKGTDMPTAELATASEMRRLYDELRGALDDDNRKLLAQLDDAYGHERLLNENRILRLVGLMLAHEGLGELFERIYALALEGFELAPGDGRRFLQRELAEL